MYREIRNIWDVIFFNAILYKIILIIAIKKRKKCEAFSSFYVTILRPGISIGTWRTSVLDPVHTGPDPYGHHINLTSFKTSMTLKFVIMLQNLIKTYHRKSGKSKCDRKVTELNVEITRIRSRVNGVLETFLFKFPYTYVLLLRRIS